MSEITVYGETIYLALLRYMKKMYIVTICLLYIILQRIESLQSNVARK